MAQETIKIVTREQLVAKDAEKKLKLGGNTFSFAEDNFVIYEDTFIRRQVTATVYTIKMKNELGQIYNVPLKFFATRNYTDATKNEPEIKVINGFCPSDRYVDIYDALEEAFKEKATFSVKTEHYTAQFTSEGNTSTWLTHIQSLLKSE